MGSCACKGRHPKTFANIENVTNRIPNDTAFKILTMLETFGIKKARKSINIIYIVFLWIF